mmetsp:Transcript_47071/g.131264  ORF Transcript_47071/g.131264 Transcript_47071/m.131264 type:complete len:125 (-) Transcript_47071:143-517(-)
MDPVMTANIQAVIASRKASSTPRSVSRASNEDATFEREKLAEARRTRGSLSFLDRMESDVHCRRAYSQVCDLRKDPSSRAALDRMVDRLRPAPTTNGPKIVSYDSKLLFEGQDRKTQWAPLECY